MGRIKGITNPSHQFINMHRYIYGVMLTIVIVGVGVFLVNKNLTKDTTKEPIKTGVALPLAETNNKELGTADLVAEWENRVVEVFCGWNNADGVSQEEVGASGLLVIFNDGLNVITNSHVILNNKGKVADWCVAGIYGVGARTVDYKDGDLNPFYALQSGKDGAFILVDSKYLVQQSDDGKFDTFAQEIVNPCPNDAARIGDKLVILGYPSIGARGGITVTEGIISGFDGDYYVTSAKIDHGNSGGAAILAKNNCYLGIPTWVENNGGFESLGRILKASFFFK